MKEINFEKRADKLKKDVNKNKTVQKKNGKICINEKLCPFMSTPNAEVACTEQCKIHRADKKGFECIFSELVPISFNASKIRIYIKNYLGLKD